MDLVDVMLFIFGAYGLQSILSIGKPTKPLRNLLEWISGVFVKFFKCPLCVGFWSGLIVGLIFYFVPAPLRHLILSPLAGAGICYFFSNLTYFSTMSGTESGTEPEVEDI